MLNELEWVNGFVLANVWFKDVIYKIDPSTSQVSADMMRCDVMPCHAASNYVN
jgi:glutamine cyclotransferase